jgi:hypothetical protein
VSCAGPAVADHRYTGAPWASVSDHRYTEHGDDDLGGRGGLTEVGGVSAAATGAVSSSWSGPTDGGFVAAAGE